MNLNTLAKLAGVSVATVSKAFSGSGEISEETKNKIFEIAKANGVYDRYNKNKFDKKVIAVICPELKSNYYNSFITTLDREISACGGIMTVSVTNFSDKREEELFAYYSAYCKADGIISISQRSIVKSRGQIPAVGVFPSAICGYTDAVKADTYKAIEDAVMYLKGCGHTDIGFVGEELTIGKQEMFKDSLRKAAIPVIDEYIHISNLRFEEAGVNVIEEWLKSGAKLPTAIVAAYDYIAIGVIKALKNAGIRVPEDVSVVGMDDINVVPYLETPLSSIRNNTELACRAAAELIMKKIENRFYIAKEPIIIPSEFVVRSSSGKRKGL